MKPMLVQNREVEEKSKAFTTLFGVAPLITASGPFVTEQDEKINVKGRVRVYSIYPKFMWIEIENKHFKVHRSDLDVFQFEMPAGAETVDPFADLRQDFGALLEEYAQAQKEKSQ